MSNVEMPQVGDAIQRADGVVDRIRGVDNQMCLYELESGALVAWEEIEATPRGGANDVDAILRYLTVPWTVMATLKLTETAETCARSCGCRRCDYRLLTDGDGVTVVRQHRKLTSECRCQGCC